MLWVPVLCPTPHEGTCILPECHWVALWDRRQDPDLGVSRPPRRLSPGGAFSCHRSPPLHSHLWKDTECPPLSHSLLATSPPVLRTEKTSTLPPPAKEAGDLPEYRGGREQTADNRSQESDLAAKTSLAFLKGSDRAREPSPPPIWHLRTPLVSRGLCCGIFNVGRRERESGNVRPRKQVQLPRTG